MRHLSSDCIATRSVHRLCSLRSSFTSSIQICNPTDIGWAAVKYTQNWSEFDGFSITTERLFVRSQVWMWDAQELLKLHNLRTDHVTIRPELTYLIGAKNLQLRRLGFKVENGLNATVLVFDVVKPLQRFGSGSNPSLELFYWVGTVSNNKYLQANSVLQGKCNHIRI